MTKPDKAEWNVGATRSRQTIALIRDKDGSWTIVKHAESQRDTTDYINGISADVLIRMAEIAREHK